MEIDNKNNNLINKGNNKKESTELISKVLDQNWFTHTKSIINNQKINNRTVLPF